MLDDRKSAILRAVVQQYIETAQPVGSNNVVGSTGVAVSPATVRSEMTVLEREGYLVQPHTSAGRVPTEKGYRFFVDALGGPGELGPAQVRQVRAFFSHAHGELEGMLRESGRLLSRLTSTTAVVVGEQGERATIRSIQLVSLSSALSLVVVVLSSGAVLKKTIEMPVETTPDDLAAIQSVVAAQVIGRALFDLGEAAPTGDAQRDALTIAALSAVRLAAEEEGLHVYVDGASRIAGAFAESETLQQALALLEQQLTVVSMIQGVMDRGLTVAIGSEHGVLPLSECSVVVAPFLIDGEHAGTIGVLGPTRMNYPETLAAVATVSERLSRLLTEG